MLNLIRPIYFCQRFSSTLTKYKRELWRINELNPFLEIPEAWVTDLNDIETTKRSIIQLHPGKILILRKFLNFIFKTS